MCALKPEPRAAVTLQSEEATHDERTETGRTHPEVPSHRSADGRWNLDRGGIPDFRGPSGIYVTRQYDPEKTFDIDWFDTDRPTSSTLPGTS